MLIHFDEYERGTGILQEVGELDADRLAVGLGIWRGFNDAEPRPWLDARTGRSVISSLAAGRRDTERLRSLPCSTQGERIPLSIADP